MTWVRWARTDDRRAADDLVRDVVADAFGWWTGMNGGAGAGVGRLCPQCGSDRHGRPLLKGATSLGATSVSVSRTTGLTLVAVSRSGAVGVDVEDLARFTVGPLADSGWGGFAGVLLHPLERATTSSALATTWVRKEALLKAQGQGLALDPRALRLSAAEDAPRVVDWPGHDGPWWLRDLVLGPGLRAAVAGRGAPPAELSVQEVSWPEAGRAEPLGPATGRRGHQARRR